MSDDGDATDLMTMGCRPVSNRQRCSFSPRSHSTRQASNLTSTFPDLLGDVPGLC